MTPDERIKIVDEQAKWVQIEEHPEKISTELLRTQVKIAVMNGIKAADPELQIEQESLKSISSLDVVRRQVNTILATALGRDEDGFPRVGCILYNRDTHWMPSFEPMAHTSTLNTLKDYKRAEDVAAHNLSVAHDRWQNERAKHKHRAFVEDERAAKAKLEIDKSPRRKALREGRDHLTISGTFQSDKYEWCPAGFVPLKLTDPDARQVLKTYAQLREKVDGEFRRDLDEAIRNQEGADPL